MSDTIPVTTFELIHPILLGPPHTHKPTNSLPRDCTAFLALVADVRVIAVLMATQETRYIPMTNVAYFQARLPKP